MAYSMAGLAERLNLYADHFSDELQQLDAAMRSHGLADADLATLLSPQTIASLFAAFIGVLTDALQQAFLILLLLLFFLAEGPLILARLRASLDRGDPNPLRLASFGRDVSQYVILRAAVNAVIGAGVALVLWLLGVDFPLLWGVLTFFLSFVPYVGMFLASLPSVLLAWAEFDVIRALVVIIALTVVNAAAENPVQPALMHRGLHLSHVRHPVAVLLELAARRERLVPGGATFARPAGDTVQLSGRPLVRRRGTHAHGGFSAIGGGDAASRSGTLSDRSVADAIRFVGRSTVLVALNGVRLPTTRCSAHLAS